MFSPARVDDIDQDMVADDDVSNYPALLDLEGNFISSFLGGQWPAEQDDASPFPFSSLHPDSSRTLTRLTQRLILDINTRKLGHDAYASSSSDAEEEISGNFARSAKAGGVGSGTKDARKASKTKTASADARVQRSMSGGERRTKVKKSIVSPADDEELDGFVVPDGDVLSEYDDDDNEHTCVVTSNALASPLTSCSYHVPTGADARKRQHTGSNDFASSDSDHVRATTSSRASALVQLCSSSSSSDSDDVLDLTLSSYHSPRRNRASTLSAPPQRQTHLNFAASRGDSSTGRPGAAHGHGRATTPTVSADAKDSLNFPQKLTFCVLADVKSTRIFAENNVRAWSGVRVTAWQSRSNDIHRFMMHLPFPHEGAATNLHLNQHWSRCESDRLLDVIDRCIQNGVCVNSNWSYISFHLRCRTGHQCRTHFNNLIVEGEVAQEKYTLCCQGASSAFGGEEDWALQLTEKWKDVNMRNLEASVENALNASTASRVSKKKDAHHPESLAHIALCKEYASKTLKLQVQALRFVPQPRMPPIQIIPPDFPRYSLPSERAIASRQEKSSRGPSDNVQIFQSGTASKGAPLNSVKTSGDRGKTSGQRRPTPSTLREANDAGSEHSNYVDDQDFSRSLSSHSTASTTMHAQSGILLVLRDFMGCHTLDIINMATQALSSEIEDAVVVDALDDPKTRLFEEVKYIQRYFDTFASADEEARVQHLNINSILLVGSCKRVYAASQSIVADDAALVRDDVNFLALNLCDLLQKFSHDRNFCYALNFLLKALVKLQNATPQLLDNVLISCICLAQDSPVLLEECSSPRDLSFSKAYIQLFLTTASAFTNEKPGLWENLTRLFCSLSDQRSTVSFEWFWELVCVGVGCMHRLHLQSSKDNPKALTALFLKLVGVTIKEFDIILRTYSVHRANNYAITMMERMLFLLEFCNCDAKACAAVLGFSCIACFQCKADAHIFVDDCCRDLSTNLPWESLRGQLLQRPCAAFSILFQKLAKIPSMAQKSERARANVFLNIFLETLKNQKPKCVEALKENAFSAARDCRHVLRLICRKKDFILKQGSEVMHSGCTNCCLEILEFLEKDNAPIVIFLDAMTALRLFIEPLTRSLPQDVVFQEHDVVRKILDILPKFRGNSEGHIGDGRFSIEFRTKVSCFVVSILRDFCVAKSCFTDTSFSFITQLLDFVHTNIRNLFFEANRLNNSNPDHSQSLVGVPQLESALSDLCSVTASLCVDSSDESNVVANKIYVSRAIMVTFFKSMFEDGKRMPCSVIKCCVATFHRLVTGHGIVLDKVEEFERKLQSLHDELYSTSCELAEYEHASDAISDSNDDSRIASISSLMERRDYLEKECSKEETFRPLIVNLADALRRACAQLPDSLIWHLHGLIISRYADSTQDKRDSRFKVTEELSQICMRSFTLEWRVRAQMDSFFKTNHSPWEIWFKFFGPESTSITIVSGMRLKEGQYTTAATTQRLLPLHAAMLLADAASSVVTSHPDQFLRVWLLFALDVKCPKHENRALFDSLCRVLFPNTQLPSMLSVPFQEPSDDCAIVCRQILHLSVVIPSSASARGALGNFCGFFESALQFGLGCLLLVPQYIRDQQSDLTRYVCRIAALLCKLFWRELAAIPSNQGKQGSALNGIISDFFILPPKFLHATSGVRHTLEDLVKCCLLWAEVDCSAAMDTLFQIIRAQLQFLVSASGLPSRPQSAVDHIVEVLCNAAATNASCYALVIQTLQCLARSASLQMTQDVRCLCFHVIAASLCKILDSSVKRECDSLLDTKSAESAAVACCHTFVELMQELGNGADANLAEALAELRTCVCKMCQVDWASSRPPGWLVAMVRFIGCTLLLELTTVLVSREANSDKDLSVQLLTRRVDACQTACLLQMLQDFHSSINKPKMLHLSHHSMNFLMFLTSLCDSAPYAFSCEMQMATSLIASHVILPPVNSNVSVFGQMLLDVCGRQGFASAMLT